MTSGGSGHDDPPEGGGRSRAGPRRSTTERGIAPPATEDIAETDPNDRVTLDFSGPPLALPGEDSPEEGELVLDTTDVSAAPQGGLDLDLAELEEGEPDAWGRDSVRRGSGMHRVASVPPAPASPPSADAPHSLPPEGGADAIDLVDRSRPSNPDLDFAAEMKDRYALGDFTGALRAAELLLGSKPHHPEAIRYAHSSRDRLVQLYSARLGSMERVPLVAVPDSEVRWLGLDHRAGFLLSRVDGSHSLEEIIDVSGMPRLEALKMLTELLDAGAIRFE